MQHDSNFQECRIQSAVLHLIKKLMKILKVIGILSAALLVIFFLIGLLKPTFEYGNSIVISAPIQTVWSVYTTRKKDWIEGFQSQRLVTGNALTNNAEYETVIGSGEEMVMRETITNITPGEKIKWALDNDVLISNYAYEFKGDSTQTEVITHYKVEGKNAFMKSILFLSKSYMRNSDAEMLAAIKEIAENKK